MGLNAKKIKNAGGGGFAKQDPVDAGTYPSRLVQIIDLGLQPQRPYKGKDKPPAHCLYVTYELVDEFCVDEAGEELEDKPRWISEDFPLYSLEADLAKSTKRYNAIDPKEEAEGDWAELGGFPCNVTVTVNGEYNNVGSVSTVRPKDVKKMEELVNPVKVFSLDEPDLDVFNALPEWLQGKVKDNLEYKGSVLEGLLGGDDEEQEEEQPKEKVVKKRRKPAEDGADNGDGEPW